MTRVTRRRFHRAWSQTQPATTESQLATMQYTRLGSTGLQVSRICLGTMSFGNTEEWMVEIDKARPIVRRALDLGVNFFDTANLYSNGRSEEIMGELLKDQRDDVVLATKVRLKVGEGPNKEGLSRYHILQQARKSLKRLRTDRIDLYQIHRWDYSTPIEETLGALNDLFRPEDFDVVERVEEVAKEKGATTAQIALAWLLHKGVNAPIIGATKVEHIDEAVGSLDLQLSADDVRRLEEPYKTHRILGHT